MDRVGVLRWVDGYVAAWRDPAGLPLEELFTPGATYRTAPFEEPFAGLPAIAGLWEDGREPGEVFDLDREVVAVEDDTAVVRLEVGYRAPVPRTYRDLWILRFAPDGRCSAFEEWPFWPPGTPGDHARHAPGQGPPQAVAVVPVGSP